MRKLLIRKNKDKKYVAAITTIELVLILVILIALLLIFKEQLISLITTIFEKVTSEAPAYSMRSVKGEITVFLSLSFTLLLSFIFGILESAVIQGSKNLSRIDTDRAIYSVFGEYHQELMEQYHVFGIDLGYRTGNYEEENLIQRLHYYNSGSTDHQIKGIQYFDRSIRTGISRTSAGLYGTKVWNGSG